MRQGNQPLTAAQQDFVTQNMPLITVFLQRHGRHLFGDRRQAAFDYLLNPGLFEAARKYDPALGRPSTFVLRVLFRRWQDFHRVTDFGRLFKFRKAGVAPPRLIADTAVCQEAIENYSQGRSFALGEFFEESAQMAARMNVLSLSAAAIKLGCHDTLLRRIIHRRERARRPISGVLFFARGDRTVYLITPAALPDLRVEVNAARHGDPGRFRRPVEAMPLPLTA